MYDVVAVNIESGIVRVIADNKTQMNAEVCALMAVMRRGIEEEFYVTVQHGTYKDGDKYEAKL